MLRQLLKILEQILDQLQLQNLQEQILLLYNYAKNNQAERFAFRRKVENEVISDMRQYIKNEYIVYKVSFKYEVELKDFVKSHFYDLAGRMFSNENRLIVALANDDKSKEFTDLIVSEKFSEIYM